MTVAMCGAPAKKVLEPRGTKLSSPQPDTVFAVKADKLDVKADTSAAVVGFNLHFNTLAKAEIMGLFKR